MCWKSQGISSGIRGLGKIKCKFGSGIAQGWGFLLPFVGISDISKPKIEFSAVMVVRALRGWGVL